MKHFFRMPLFRRFVYPAGIVLLCGALIMAGCGSPAAVKSSEAKITGFKFEAAKNSMLYRDSEGVIVHPDDGGNGSIAVDLFGTGTSFIASFTASEKASVKVGAAEQESGVTANDFSSPLTYTVSAEDGTERSYEVSITYNFSGIIEAAEIAKAVPDQDRRYHYVAFTLTSVDDSDQGIYRLGLRKTGDSKPGAQDMENGDVIHRKIDSAVKNNLLSYTLDSGIGAFAALTASQNTVNAHDDTNNVDIDKYLLEPGTEYTLFANKDGEEFVGTVAKFSTDAYDGKIYMPVTNTGSARYNDSGLFGSSKATPVQYPVHRNDKVFVMPSFNAQILNNADLITFTKDTDQLANIYTPGNNFLTSPYSFSRGITVILRSSLAAAPDKQYINVGSSYLGIDMLALPISVVVDTAIAAGTAQTHVFTYSSDYKVSTTLQRSDYYSTFLDE